MAYQALYRKYRPQTFEDVCGRDTIVRTIKNQINNGRIGHSYLFCGTRGTGKTTIAKIFAKAVNCENPQDGNPCGECASCRAISEDANLNVVEMDAASNNSVEDIRAVIEQVKACHAKGQPVRREYFNFGKYKGQLVTEVLQRDPGYYGWIMNGDFTYNLKQVLTKIQMRELKKRLS